MRAILSRGAHVTFVALVFSKSGWLARDAKAKAARSVKQDVAVGTSDRRFLGRFGQARVHESSARKGACENGQHGGWRVQAYAVVARIRLKLGVDVVVWSIEADPVVACTSGTPLVTFYPLLLWPWCKN